jgi:hypothetical protein
MTETEMKEDVQACLVGMLGENLAQDWWSGKNSAFDNQTPADEWLRNRNKVYDYVMQHAYGGW